ncbi:MAG: ABC transporter ATP-binding protein [Deltaproteobacteria bacterium]|mgnify:CR=1 FL=1|nr:ABC transporter ATP-binding protein [Deltaproteobacteria bacterium]MBW1918868.1 ABC transporter ATP-binding protein [Deltaproteobacteria bacterium]MBW1936466.1 ABC transporter ATP-binding protein [Deltaproteobacteria bacterium]MBW1976729.1 ABC transporter ATP-binding protein [Deltaproteobacteria bacterium]MBW2045719.1 ABC transporter ATP-binding protein [Deltaproteobacteria bacterium]
MPETLLEAREINTYYGHIHALKGISVKAKRGGLVAIIGANGAGKSTLLKTVMGLVRPSSGRVIYDQEEITLSPTHKIVRHGLSLVLEGRQLFGPLSVRDNLLLGTYNLSRQRRKKDLQESLNRVYSLFTVLKERSDQKAGTLSGGEQQMLAIGRALMSSPSLLLLDEPSLGLAPLFVKEIFRTLDKLNQQGISILLVEQNARLALQISHYGYVLDTGRIAAEGPSGELLEDEKVKSAYLGKKKQRPH